MMVTCQSGQLRSEQAVRQVETNLRNSGLCVGVQELRAMTNDAAILLLTSNQHLKKPCRCVLLGDKIK